MSEPLNRRLRAEATEWGDGESVKALLLEAAEAVEVLAARAALYEWTMSRVESLVSPAARSAGGARTGDRE